MYVCLNPLIKWPGREELLKTMPMDFRKNFRNCFTIIDCLEVFMERPTNVKDVHKLGQTISTTTLLNF